MIFLAGGKMAGKKRQAKVVDPEKFSYAPEEKADDIYDEETREEQLEGDEITAAEEGFMRGWDGEIEGGKKNKKTNPHNDMVSVEMTKNQYGED
jgi:hypothetical protein